MDSIARDQLERAYGQSKTSHVAFIDESYLSPSMRDSRAGLCEATFYLLTAFVAPRAGLDAIRRDIDGIAGTGFWHSTDAHRTSPGREQLREFASYIASGPVDEHAVMAVRAPIGVRDRVGEVARAWCMARLLGALCTGSRSPRVDLAVVEQRRTSSHRNIDFRTVKRLRHCNVIARHDQIHMTSPSVEHLLWVPDVISFAMYRWRASRDSRYVRSLADRIVTIPA